MSKQVLTDRRLRSLKPAAAGKRYIEWDIIVPSLGVRVTDKGTFTFVLVTRFPDSKHPTPRELGKYGALTLEAARAKARLWLEMISKGIDPKREAERDQLERQRRRKNSFAAVAEDFIKREVKKKRRGAAMERELRREFITRWCNRPVTEITQHDVLEVLDEVVARDAPYQAHALFGHVRRLFNWAIGRGSYDLTASPCDRLKPTDAIGKRTARTRTLTDEELCILWRVTGRLGYPFGSMYRFLLLSGLRRNEVSDAHRRELHLEQKVWVIPGERMKGGQAHVVPLTDEMLALLDTLPRHPDGFLFSSTLGSRPVSGFSKMKARLDQRMGRTQRALARIEGRRCEPTRPWRTHDIRRTVRTHLSALPVSDLVRELVIGHAKPGLHKVYDQYAYLDEKREALELWGRRLLAMVELGAAAPSKIVPLRKVS
jgi:integrase